MDSTTRRQFLQGSSPLAASILMAAGARKNLAVAGPDTSTDYFTVDRRLNRWWIIAPDDRPTFLLGLNHIDPTTIRQAGDGRLWQQRYGGKIDRWLQECVRVNLRDWQFNAIGQTAEFVKLGDSTRHFAGGLSLSQTRSLRMPFCWQIPWDSPNRSTGESPPSDCRSKAFALWCDRIAREHCQRLVGERYLIGYWYRNRPQWASDANTGDPHAIEQAIAFYRTTTEALRRYDPHHLILGDVLPSSVRLSDRLAKVIASQVDVLSLAGNQSSEALVQDIKRLSQSTDGPILIADHGIDRTPNDGHWPPTKSRYLDPSGYASTLHRLTETSQTVGYFLCGSFLRSPVLRRGLLDENERPDSIAIDRIQRTNAVVDEWVRALF